MSLKAVILFVVVFMAVTNASLMPGGATDVDVNRNDVQNALQFAIVQHNRGSNDAFVNQVSKVIKAQVQVVSGLNYIFNVEMVRTSCRKGGVEKVCAAHPDPKVQQRRECEMRVWSQPWTSSIKLMKNTC